MSDDHRPWWNVADGRLDVVRDPLDEVAAVLVLYAQHLFVHLTHRHLTAEDCRNRQIATVTRVTGRHHVLRVKHLLCQLWHGQGAVLLAATRRQGSKARHEEVQTREWNHVDRQFTEICVELQTDYNCTHCSGVHTMYLTNTV